MNLRTPAYKYNFPLLKAAGINLVIFIVFITLTHPVYNSLEDIYVLYRLSGGYGDPPTEMLDFNLGLHPFLNLVLKNLFLLTNRINWYTVSIFLAHYIFCTIVLNYIIRRINTLMAYAAYAALFLVFEGYFLLSPDFTGTSMILTCTALLVLLTRAWDHELKTRDCILAVVLFVIASFYRMEPMIVLPGIALPFLALTVHEKIKWKLLGVLCIAGLFIFLFNAIHKSYYTNRHPGWPQEEAYRQKALRFFNEAASLQRPVAGEKWFPEYQVLKSGLIIDTATLPSVLIDSIHTHLRAQRMEKRSFSTDWKDSSEWRKWFLINNRLFFFIGFFFILLYGLKRNILPALLISLFFFIGGFGYLLVKAKTEPYILASSLSFICFTIFLCTKQDILRNTKVFRMAALAGLFFFIAWGGIRLYKTSAVNSGDNERFRQQYAELSAHPEKLFIHIKGFAIQKFYAFDSPASFPLPNFLQAERFTAHNYASTLSRFGIHNVKEIFSSPDVLFWGHPPDGLKTYFEKVAGKPLLRTDPLPEFKHGIVWRVIQDSGQLKNKDHRN